MQIGMWAHKKIIYLKGFVVLLDVTNVEFVAHPHFLAPSISFRSELRRNKEQRDPTAFTFAWKHEEA